MQNMHSILITTLNKHAPLIIKKVKGKSSPWLNENIRREMNIRDNLLRIFRKHNTPENWDNYKIQRNKVNNLNRKEKKEYYNVFLQEHSSNPRKFRKTIKDIFPIKTNLEQSCREFKINNEGIKDKLKIADGFCNFFIH